jgi:hypothetical protein
MAMAAYRRRLVGSVTMATVSVCLLFAPPAFAVWSQKYLNDTYACIGPGEGANSAWQGSLALNYVSPWDTCAVGYLPQMGTTYERGDRTLYPYKWSNQGNFGLSDTRTVSYGRAICKTNSGNGTGISYVYCLTSQ